MKKVLIVDDASFIRISLRRILENNNFEVVGEAANGKDAIEMYQLLCPDIITLDITMPVMDGIEALEAIKTLDNKAKVVMISALGQEAYIKKAIFLGADGFIVKPWKEEYVIDTLLKV